MHVLRDHSEYCVRSKSSRKSTKQNHSPRNGHLLSTAKLTLSSGLGEYRSICEGLEIRMSLRGVKERSLFGQSE